MKIIALTPENIGTEHICCALADKKGEQGVALKKEWLKSRFAEGLTFKRLDQRGKVFIEFLPAQYAWVPIEAQGYMFINCHWVAGSFKGQGWGRQLYAECEKAAVGMKGIVVISSTKKRPYLSDKRFFLHNGFRVCDTAGIFELLVKPFGRHENLPRFRQKAKQLQVESPKGIDIYFTHQCPFAVNYAAKAKAWAKGSGRPVRVHHLADQEAARDHACPVTNYSVFLDGNFVTHEILTQAKLEKLLAE